MKVMDVTTTGERLIGNQYPHHSIPLKVTVTAPTDISDFALSYITQVLRDNITIITENLQKLDGTTLSFNDVVLNIDTYDWNDVLMFGMNTMTPTKVPTAAPPEPEPVEIVDESSSSDGIPWWVWILVVLAILGCMAVVCCCYCYYKNDEEEDEYNRMNNSKERQINMFVHNRMHMTPPPSKNGQQSVAVASQYTQRRLQNGNGDQATFLGQPIAVSSSHRSRSRQPKKARNDGEQGSRARNGGGTKHHNNSSHHRSNNNNNNQRSQQKKRRKKPSSRTTTTRDRLRNSLNWGRRSYEEEQEEEQEEDYSMIDNDPNSNVLVLYDDENQNQNPHARDPTEYNEGFGGVVSSSSTSYKPKTSKKKRMAPRDPTYYEEEDVKNNDIITSNNQAEEPEGDKLAQRKSMLADEAMDEMDRKREEEVSPRRNQSSNTNRRGSWDMLKSSFRWTHPSNIPEPPEEYDNNDNNNNNGRGGTSGRRNSIKDRFRASFNWRNQSNADYIEELEDCPQIDLEIGGSTTGGDSPSILTNNNPGDGDGNRRRSEEYEADREEDERAKRKKRSKKSKSSSSSSRKKKNSKNSGGNDDDGDRRRRSGDNRKKHLFSSIKRKSVSSLSL